MTTPGDHTAEKDARIETLPVPQQWDRHRAMFPRHTATVTDRRPPYTIFCNDCLWHDYGPPVEGRGGGDR